MSSYEEDVYGAVLAFRHLPYEAREEVFEAIEAIMAGEPNALVEAAEKSLDTSIKR